MIKSLSSHTFVVAYYPIFRFIFLILFNKILKTLNLNLQKISLLNKRKYLIDLNEFTLRSSKLY